ncbi:MAG: Tim44 domain-containing protein [Hellea sp.]|nr:Tim44 domain-containing protein [Hellea sp.]
MSEIILYAAIATIICAMLYSVLGKSVGRGPESAVDPTQFMAKTDVGNPAIIDPLEEYGDFPNVGNIRKFDPGFSLTQFQDQAQGAYAVILDAFAEADRSLLKELLTKKVYALYEEAITNREADNLTQITDLARIMGTNITGVSVKNNIARISVEFEAELASALTDADGKVLQGDPNLLSRSTEIWSFERDLKSSNPNWLLADVAASEGDEQEVDPTPDTLH